MNKPREQLLIAFSLVILLACLSPALTADVKLTPCEELDESISLTHTRTKAFCVYYNTSTQLASNTVNDSTNSQKILRQQITIGTNFYLQNIWCG